MTNYPNIRALAEGRVSGTFAEWPRLQLEALKILAEVKQGRALQDRVNRATMARLIHNTEEKRHAPGAPE